MYSVLIPAFKSQDFLEEAISVFVESGRCQVVIGIDGCSTTLRAARKLPADIYYSHENVGSYMIRNSLVKYARHKRLIFFDADDVPLPNILEQIEATGKDIVRFKYQNFNHPKVHSPSEEINVSEGVFMIDRDKFVGMNGFFTRYRCGFDTEFRKRTEHHRMDAGLTDEVVFLRRFHATNVTRMPKTRHGGAYRKNVQAIIRSKELRKDFPHPPKFVERRLKKVSAVPIST